MFPRSILFSIKFRRLLSTHSAYQFELEKSTLESHFDIKFKDRSRENLWKRLSLLNVFVQYISILTKIVQDRSILPSRVTLWSIINFKEEKEETAQWELAKRILSGIRYFIASNSVPFSSLSPGNVNWKRLIR